MGQRVLIVLEAGQAYPSGFIRGLIYQDYFRRAGFETEYVNRLFPPLVQLLGTPSRFLRPILVAGLGKGLFFLQEALAYAMENNIVEQAKRHTVVYLSKVSSFRLLRRLRQETRARLVLDFGDALWLPRYRVAHFRELLGLVDAVTTDNELTAAYIRQYNPHCVVIPDCPQVEWFDQQRTSYRRTDAETITLGWLGTPGTVYNLYVIWEALEQLFVRHPNLHLRLVGTGPEHPALPPFEKIKYSCRPRYSQAEMIREVLDMDIGLFPLQDVEASQVRGVLKATVYMAGEAVVVCSPVGQCVELIREGVNGFLAGSSQEWAEKLEYLIVNSPIRRQVAAAGLETVRKSFTVEQSFAKLSAVLDPAGIPAT
jgi:glycosyltransferase involved in cell wall biosynthesis